MNTRASFPSCGVLGAGTLLGVFLLLSLAVSLPARAQAPDFSPFAGRWIQGRLALQVEADGSAQLAGSDAGGRLYTADVQFETVYNVGGDAIAAGRITHDYQAAGSLAGNAIYLGVYPQPAGVGFLAIGSGNWMFVCTPAAPSQFFGPTC